MPRLRGGHGSKADAATVPYLALSSATGRRRGQAGLPKTRPFDDLRNITPGPTGKVFENIKAARRVCKHVAGVSDDVLGAAG